MVRKLLLLAFALLVVISGSALAATTELVTAVDPYLPVLVWGGAACIFLYFGAWLPAVASMMAMAAGLRDPPFWSISASAMLVIVAVALHKMVLDGIVPTPWRRKR